MSAVAGRLVPRWRLAALVAGIAWLALLLMALWVHDSRDPKPIDDTVLRWLLEHTGTGAQQAMLALTEPVLTVGGCAVVGLGALIVRRFDVLALAVIGPLGGLFLESHVLKPWINRLYGLVEELTQGRIKAGYAFPSGHETGLTSLTTLLVIVLLTSGASRRWKAALTAIAALWTFVGALGLVRSGYHYFTDTLGGIALAVGLMLTVALVVDVVAARFSSPAGRGRTRTARAA